MIYKVTLNRISQIVYGIICLFWIIFAFIKFEINPAFFQGSIIFMIFLFLIIPITEITLFDNSITISRKRCFSLIQNKRNIDLQKIKDINYQPLEINLLIIIAFTISIALLPGGTTMLNGNNLKIILNDNTIINENVGVKREKVKELIKLTKKQLQLPTTPHV